MFHLAGAPAAPRRQQFPAEILPLLLRDRAPALPGRDWEVLHRLLDHAHRPHHLVRAWDGSSSQPLKSDSGGILEVNTELPAAAALADGASNPTAPAVGAAGLLYNGSTYDRERGNVEGTLLASAARTTTTATATQTNYNHRGVVLFLYVPTMPGGARR